MIKSRWGWSTGPVVSLFCQCWRSRSKSEGVSTRATWILHCWSEAVRPCPGSSLDPLDSDPTSQPWDPCAWQHPTPHCPALPYPTPTCPTLPHPNLPHPTPPHPAWHRTAPPSPCTAPPLPWPASHCPTPHPVPRPSPHHLTWPRPALHSTHTFPQRNPPLSTSCPRAVLIRKQNALSPAMLNHRLRTGVTVYRDLQYPLTPHASLYQNPQNSGLSVPVPTDLRDVSECRGL